MAVTTRSLLNIIRDVGNELGRWPGRASGGSTTTVIDTSGDSGMSADDSDQTFPNAWVMVEGNNGVDLGEVATSTRARTTNVATIVTATVHGLATSDKVNIRGMGAAAYNGTALTITVTNTTTFTYASTGSDETTATDTGGVVSGPSPQGEIRRISTFDGSTQTLTLRSNSAFGVAVAANHEYAVYFGVPPERVGPNKGIKEFVNDVLRETYYNTLALLSLAVDADMEASGTTSWTATNSTLAKATTTATGVRWGSQALQVTDSGSGNGYASQTFNVVPGQSFVVAVDAFGSTSGTGVQIKLNCYDVTGAADISSGSFTGTVDEGQIRTLWAQFAIPSGCKLMRVELIVVTVSGVGYFDNLSVRNTQAEEMDLPSWLTHPSWVRGVEYHMSGGSVTSYGADPTEGWVTQPRSFKVIEDRTGVTAYRIKMWPPLARSEGHVLVRAIRQYGELSRLGSTTTCNLDYLRAIILARILTTLGKDKEAQRWAAEALALGRSYNAAMPMQPGVQLQMGESA